jgi:hypothetical protein
MKTKTKTETRPRFKAGRVTQREEIAELVKQCESMFDPWEQEKLLDSPRWQSLRRAVGLDES